MKHFHVYILSSHSRVLYIGVTSDLENRLRQHREKMIRGFTSRYNVDQLVWYEPFPNVSDAIAAEKKIKGWTRAKKIELIEQMNPLWADLSDHVTSATRLEDERSF